VKWLHQRLFARLLARRRAEHLLLEFLTPERRRDYCRSGGFIVESQLGHRYHVGRACRFSLTPISTRRLERDGRGTWQPVMAHCLVPAAGQGTMPDADSMLATALWLTCDEQRFLQTAVSTRIESALTAQMVTFALTRTFGLF
jgi:hypothetical protein